MGRRLADNYDEDLDRTFKLMREQVRSTGWPAATGEIAKSLGVHSAYATRWLQELQRRGRVEGRKGRWRPKGWSTTPPAGHQLDIERDL